MDMNTRKTTMTLSKLNHTLSCSLLALASLLTNGCIVSVTDPGPKFVDESFPEEPRCDHIRNSCLARAGSDPKFQETCHESYRECVAGAQKPGKGHPTPDEWEPEENPEDPSTNLNDPAWNQRCDAIEDSCFASAGTSDEKIACSELGEDCARTFCGEGKSCSSYQASPELLTCWNGFLTCNDKARDEDEIASCGTVFRLCGQSIKGFETLEDQDDEDVLDCLTTSLKCQSAAKGQAELEESCRTVLSFCVVN